MSDGRTHWEGCWREPGHHECAVAQVERLQNACVGHLVENADEIARLRALNAELVEALEYQLSVLEDAGPIGGKARVRLIASGRAALSRARETEKSS